MGIELKEIDFFDDSFDDKEDLLGDNADNDQKLFNIFGDDDEFPDTFDDDEIFDDEDEEFFDEDEEYIDEDFEDYERRRYS